MEALFAYLSKAVEGSCLSALTASFIWGILSIILSPCHLAAIPLIVGFIDEQKDMTPRRAFSISFLFALGILITIAVIGILTAVTGRMLGDIGPYVNYVVAIIFLAAGLHLLGVIPLPLNAPGKIGIKRKGFFAAFLLGLIFGIALGPCTFAYMAPMLAVTFRLASSAPVYGFLLLAMYGLGHCAVIVFAGTGTEWVQRYLNWNEASKGSVLLKKGCGILVLLGGLYLIYSAP